jgi:hypothetical protein
MRETSWPPPRHARDGFSSCRWAEDLAAVLVRRNELQQEMRSLHDGASIAVLGKARVIGCTTTGAALYKELLRDVQVDPGVVLVEEAGELLEAHVLTSLSRRTKHLIMVGWAAWHGG